MSTTRRITKKLVEQFAEVSGDHNPLHLDASYAAHTRFKKPIAHGMLTASLISAEIARQYPKAVYFAQTVFFLKPVYYDDSLTVQVYETCKITSRENGRVYYDLFTEVRNQKDDIVLDGNAEIFVDD